MHTHPHKDLPEVALEVACNMGAHCKSGAVSLEEQESNNGRAELCSEGPEKPSWIYGKILKASRPVRDNIKKTRPIFFSQSDQSKSS